MSYFVYILQSLKDGSYYVGSTQDLEDRVQRHNQGRSKYTKSKRPWQLVYHEEHPDRSSATKREYGIKGKKRKAFVEQLVRTIPPCNGGEGRPVYTLFSATKSGRPPFSSPVKTPVIPWFQITREKFEIDSAC